MQFLICPKHNKTQKAAHKITTNSYICMNRYCQQSFVSLCNICKNDHRDHSNKVLTFEDITFLIERLLKSPFKELTQYIDEAVTAMKKFKLIQENKRKIEILEREIYKEVMGLVEFTQSLIHEYALCKKKITELSDSLVSIETPEVFLHFTKNSRQFLSNLEYNFQKDKLEYGNQTIREKYENRRKSIQKTKRRLEEVKDYSMKIIEVILANEDSEQEEEDIIYKKKMYEILKRELEEANQSKFVNISNQKNSLSGEKEVSKQCSVDRKEKHEKDSTINNTNTKQISQTGEDKISKPIPSPNILPTNLNSILSISKSSQTCSDWLKAIEQTTKSNQTKIKKIQQSNAKALNELQNKISILVKQKEAAKKESAFLQHKHKIKNQKILEIQAKIRENHIKRQVKEKQRETKFQKLIDIANWRGILQGDRID